MNRKPRAGKRYGGQSGHTADDCWKMRQLTYQKQAADDTRLYAWLERVGKLPQVGAAVPAAHIQQYHEAVREGKA